MRSRWGRHHPIAPLAALLLAALLLWGPGPRAQAQDERDFEPVPPAVVFPDPTDLDPVIAREIAEDVGGSFADLNKVVDARERLVRRYGVVSLPELTRVLVAARNVPFVWNALLTVAGLRTVYGPALPLQGEGLAAVASHLGGGDPWTPAFAALAVGCYRWNEVPEDLPDAFWPVPGPRKVRRDARRVLGAARRLLIQRATDTQAPVSIASLLALAKSGGADAQAGVAAIDPSDYAHVPQRQAALLARGLLGCEDPRPLMKPMQQGEQQAVAAAAALAVALALVREERPSWTADHERIEKALRRLELSNQAMEGAEALFARGLNLLQNQGPQERWREIWERVSASTTEREVAEAGAQILLFCPEPSVRAAMVRAAVSERAAEPPEDAVLALVLLTATEQGSPAAVRTGIGWLRSGHRRPRPSPRWDPRWYVAVGLLRAFHHGRLEDPKLRSDVLGALRFGAAKVLQPGPVREALEGVLRLRSASLERDPALRLTRAEIAPVEEAIHKVESAQRAADVAVPGGLLSRDPRDAAIHRLNAMLRRVMGVEGLPPPTGPDRVKYQGERYLKRYLDRYPYFTRRDLRLDRGKRQAPVFDDDAPLELDR